MNSDRVMDRVRSANPVPVPPPADEQVRSKIIAGPGDPRLAAPAAGTPRWRQWSRTLGATLAALAAVGALVVAVLAFALLKHQPHSGTGSVSTAAANTPKLTIVPAQGLTIGPHGSAISATARIVGEAPDPRGGLPWGLREVRTTRGQVCLQVGRLQGEDGVIGVLGQDGAWGNDHRFHPLAASSPRATGSQYCGNTDGNGNAFISISIFGEAANAFGQVLGSPADHCVASSSTGRPEQPPSPCPKVDQRDLAYGLLGPDAESVTYFGLGGRLYSEPTSGSDGAYLIVVPETRSPCAPDHLPGHCYSYESTFGPRVEPGIIAAVTYRDGRVCRLPAPARRVETASCPPVGYAPRVTHVTQAQLAAPVTARATPAPLALDITFAARVPVTSLNSYYQYVVNVRPDRRRDCPGDTQVGTTTGNIRAGRRVVFRVQGGDFPAGCSGLALHGTVAFMSNAGLGMPGFESTPLLVGKFESVVP